MTKNILFAILLTLLSASLASAVGLNIGLIESAANQDADLELTEVPRNMSSAGTNLVISWRPNNVRGILRYSSRYMGDEPEDYQNEVETYVDRRGGRLTVNTNQLPVGYLYCIIEGEDGTYSVVFNIIRTASSSPQMTAPITGNGRQGINTVTPVFQWRPVQGVPYYHIVVSDQPFQITEDENGNTKVEGANIIWQAITSQTSILYGIPDPSEFFDNERTPPLVGNRLNSPRPRYSWVVLNNYGNNPSFSSTVTGGVAGFEIEVEPPFAQPQNIAPANGLNIVSREIIFRWREVQEAVSYFIYVNREERTAGGSQAFIPIWNAQTTLTSIACPAPEVLGDGRYVWKVVAASRQGRGTMSDTTSFSYSLASGEVSFTTRNANNARLEYVEITTETIEGPSIASFSTDDGGSQTRDIPVGTYVFTAQKNGYLPTQSDRVTVEEDGSYSVTFTMEAMPSSMVGTVVNQDNTPISGAIVTARKTGTNTVETTETNISGQYQLLTEPGVWLLTASARGHRGIDEIPIEVHQNETVDVNRLRNSPIVLQAFRNTISGTVRNPLGQPIHLATVVLEDEQGRQQRAFTPDGGNYSFIVGPGRWNLNALKPGFYLESGTITINMQDSDQEVNFTLVPQAGILSGQVFLDGNIGNRNADVWFIPTAGEVTIVSINQAGAFSRGVSPGDYIVTPVRQGYSTGDSLRISVGPAETISGLRLNLRANPSSISGRVLNDADNPVNGAQITAAGVTVQTDGSGNYRITVPAGSHTVTARYAGHETSTIGPVGVEVAQHVVGINHRLVGNAATVSGRVRRGNDAIFDAVVTAVRTDNNTQFTTRTDREGRYSFALRFGTYQITVRKDGFIAAEPRELTVQLQPAQNVTDRNFAMLSYASRIAGTVSSQGQPVNSPVIRIIPIGAPEEEVTTTGNVEGAFALTVRPDRRYVVIATRQGFGTASDTTQVLNPESEAAFRFSLNALPSNVRGVITVNNNPLSDVTVQASGQRGNYTARTDRDGRYQIDLESGEYRISASRPGYTTNQTDVRINPGEQRQGVNLALNENFALISGIITTNGNTPVVQATVTLIDTVSNRRLTATTDNDGAYLIDRIIPGTYRIEATHMRYSTARLLIGAIVGGQQRRGVNMQMNARNSIFAGQVRAGETPVAQATIFALSEDQEYTTTSGQNGNFTLANLAPGNYELRGARVGYSSIVVADQELGAGDTLAVNLELIRNDGRISGFVRDPDDAGLRDARITAMDSLGHFAATTTNVSGAFLLENLYPRSTYSVSVQLANYFTDQDTLRNIAVGNDNVLFRMEPNTLSISGRTVNQAGSIISNVPIAAISLVDGERVDGTSNESGDFVLTNLARNTSYRIQTSHFADIYVNADTVLAIRDVNLNDTRIRIIERSASISGNAGAVDVLIEARNLITGRITTTYSAQDSTFRLPRLRDGNFVLRGSKLGYRVRPDSLIISNVTVGESRTGANFTTNEIRLTISGSVLDQDNQPVVGAPVIAWNPAAELRDTTADDGAYRFDNLFPDQIYRISTRLPNEGYDNAEAEVTLENADRSGIQLRIVRHNAVIRGVVQSTQGQNLRDVTVTLDETRQVITPANGGFTFANVGTGDHELVFSRSGYIQLERTVNAANGEGEYTVNVNLTALERAIYGRITAVGSIPLRSARVELIDNNNNSLSIYTSADGSYSFNQLDPDLTYRLLISKKGFNTSTRTGLRVTSESRQVNVTLSRMSGSISGNFTTTDGRVVSNAQVILRSFENIVMTDSTDLAGDFIFSPKEGNYMLMAVHPDPRAGTSYNDNVSFNSGDSLVVNLQMSDAGVISGKMLEEDGSAPRAAGLLTARHTATGDVVFNWSNPDGTFRLRGIRPGNNQLTVEASGYAMRDGAQWLDIISRDTARVEIFLTREGKAITGYIADQDGNPIPRAKVTLSGATEQVQTANELGYYSFANPHSGEHTISVFRLGYDEPEDTTFTVSAGEMIQIDRVMTLIPNAISGYINNDEGIVLENVTVVLRQGRAALDTTYTNTVGEYIFTNIDAGQYNLTAHLARHRANPDTLRARLENDQAVLSANFIMIPDRGVGWVRGRLVHRNSSVEGATVRLRNLTDGSLEYTTTNEEGRYIFSRIAAPASYRVRGINPGISEVVGDSLYVDIGDTVVSNLTFPAGQIIVNLKDVNNNPILGRRINISGLDSGIDTVLYSDASGRASTLNWLTAGRYAVTPASEPGALPPMTQNIDLAKDEVKTLTWYLGLTITPPSNIDFSSEARVEIVIPSQLTVTEGNLYYQGPGAIDFEAIPLTREGMPPLEVLGENNYRRHLRSSSTPSIMGMDASVVYYGIIPPQNRSGTLRYYLEVHTAQGYSFGGPTTIQEVVITRAGMLDQLDLRRTQAALRPQLGVPLEIRVTALDDQGTNITSTLPASAFEWSEIATSRGALTVDPNRPNVAVYNPQEEGSAKIQVKVTQANTDVVVAKTIEWNNGNQILNRMVFDETRHSIASGDSIRLTIFATDTAEVAMSILPIWQTDTDVLGTIKPIPYSHDAWFVSKDRHIGYVQITVRDSVTGKEGYFHIETPRHEMRGLAVYGKALGSAADTTEFVDGRGFSIKIPPNSINGDGVANLTLAQRQLPQVMRLTPLYESAEFGYALDVEGSIRRDRKFPIILPVPDRFVVRRPIVGIWNAETVDWDVDTTAVLASDRNSVSFVTSKPNSQFALLNTSKPLGISNLRLDPNPFSPYSITGNQAIEFHLDSDQDGYLPVSVKIYNMSGQLIRNLVNDARPKGDYHRNAPDQQRILWDGMTDDGRMARNGRYIVVVTAKDASGETKQIGSSVLVK